MSFKGLGTALGDQHARVVRRYTNRTGATILKGQVAMEDWAATQAESTNTTPGSSASIFANLGPLTEAGLAEGFPAVVCLSDSVADNVEGDFLCYGYCEHVAFADDDVSTTDLDKGDRIQYLNSQGDPVTGSTHSVGGGIVQAFVSGSLTRTLGVALEDAAASGTGVYTNKKAFWWGGKPGAGSSDT